MPYASNLGWRLYQMRLTCLSRASEWMRVEAEDLRIVPETLWLAAHAHLPDVGRTTGGGTAATRVTRLTVAGPVSVTF